MQSLSQIGSKTKICQNNQSCKDSPFNPVQLFLLQVAIGYYFESKRALATGIAETGSGFGTFVFATLLTMIASSFGTLKAGTKEETTENSEEASPESGSVEVNNENFQQSWTAPVFFIAGLCICCIIFGGLMRPLEFIRENEEEKKSVSHMPYLKVS